MFFAAAAAALHFCLCFGPVNMHASTANTTVTPAIENIEIVTADAVLECEASGEALSVWVGIEWWVMEVDEMDEVREGESKEGEAVVVEERPIIWVSRVGELIRYSYSRYTIGKESVDLGDHATYVSYRSQYLLPL